MSTDDDFTSAASPPELTADEPRPPHATGLDARTSGTTSPPPAHPGPVAVLPVETAARADVGGTEPSPRRTAKRATFAARFAAIVIDLVLLALVQVAVAWTARAAVATAGLFGRPLAGGGEIADLLAAVGGLVLPAVYFTTLHAGEGRTLGKHAMRLRVARPDGRPIGLLRSFLRWIGYEISAIPFGLGYALALGPRRRALHDLLADTVVLDAGAGGLS